MIRCARCTNKFLPEETFHMLCPECWEIVGLYGDSDSMKFWRTAGSWVNGDWTEEELKELADSAAGQEIVKDVLSHMDVGMRIRLLKQQVKELE